MKTSLTTAFIALLFTVHGGLYAKDEPKPMYPTYPSETPTHFTPVSDSFDYVLRDVMIPMRDGVKLHTVILVAKGASHAGMLLTRTPYDAKSLVIHTQSGHLGPALQGYDNATDVILEDGYIRIVQDVRGKYGSEGDYVMNRPVHGPQNPTPVDDATDTYDTIDWLVKHVPESNGKVGTIGISYDGFEPLMALVNPHPALKVSVPMNPMVDGWMGDDWFHFGAFRAQNIPYVYEQVATRDNSAKWWSNYHDDYDLYLQMGSSGELGRSHGMQQIGFWNKIVAHPNYDAFWSDQAVDKVLANQPLKVPVMLVHSLWDAEDIYGAMAVYKVIKPKDVNGDKVKLVLGPWYHGQGIDEGQQSRQPALRQRHLTLVSRARAAAVPGAILERWRAHRGRGCGDRVRNRHQRVAPPRAMARELRKRLCPCGQTAVSSAGKQAWVRAARRRCRIYRIRIGSRAPGTVSRTPHTADGLLARANLGAVVDRRSARSLRPHRCHHLHLCRADRAAEDRRATDGPSHRLHHRH
jgi:predicted acyl esterase